MHFARRFGIVESMKKKILDFIKLHHMLEENDRVIAGISGGADSVYLLFVLRELREKIGFDLIAVHVNHGIRGETALRDEEFTRELCRQWKIPCEVRNVSVPEIAARRKLSQEEAGRLVRREVFEEVRQQYQGTKIALAHHQNDNAETMLMNLARGTGIRGLLGIRPVNGCMIRPLLCLNRREIEQILKEEHLLYCEDETNAEDIYTRNRIRHQIIPALEEGVNRQAVRHMNEAMEQLGQVWEYLEDETWKQYQNIVQKREEGLFLLQEALGQCAPVIQKRVIQKCLEELAGSARDLGAVHIEAVTELLEKQSGKKRNLPYEIVASREYEGIFLQKRKEGKEDSFEKVLNIPGITRLEDKNLQICCTIREKESDFSMEQIPQNPYTKWFDYDIIKTSLAIRTRQPKDVLSVTKQGKTQKLKSYFINEKIPAGQRSQVLLIAEGHQILWVVGYRMSTKYQISEHTKKIIEIKIMEDKKDGRDN